MPGKKSQSKRSLKKELNGFLFNVIDEAAFQLIYYPESDTKKYEDLISDVLAFRNTMVSKISGARKEDNQKSYFRTMNEEFSAKVTETYKSLYVEA